MELNVYCGAIIQNDNEETLLLKLNKLSDLLEGWACPLGKLTAGEKSQDSLRRILKEELGIEVQILMEIGTMDEINDEHKHKLYFLCRIIKGEPIVKNKEKYSMLKWFSKDELPADASIQDTLSPLYMMRFLTDPEYDSRVDAIRHSKKKLRR